MTSRDRLLARGRELRATARRLSLRHAEVEELSGAVHDEAARVHEGLGRPSRLDPATLRAHAEHSRQRADVERRRAERWLEPDPD